MSDQRIAVVIVSYHSSAHIAGTLASLVQQLRHGDEVVVVDNASRDGTADAVRSAAPDATVLVQEENVGFAAGCNIGVAATSAPIILLLNPDAQPAEGCIEALRAPAELRPRWGSWQALVTMDGGSTINTSGNVVHFLGMGWVGQLGAPVSRAPRELREVGFASGAALAVRRDAWVRLGGFDERYFMYGEDLDLALRLRLLGLGVGVAPSARVEHDYSFHKGNRKWFLLERNRWWTVIGDYPTPVLALVLPAMVLAELALVVIAARDGWLREKLRAQVAVTRSLPQMLDRRRRVQSQRRVSALDFARHLSAELENPNLGIDRAGSMAGLQGTYWRSVRRLLRLLERRPA
jgi:GT2 family glycosyltransferase